MTKLHEDTLIALWESIDDDPGRFVSEEDIMLTGSVGSLDLEFSSEAPLAYEMVVRGTIETPIKKDKDIASLKDVKVIVVPDKKEEEVMEDRIYKFSEIIQMLEEGELPEGTKLCPNEWNGGNCTIVQGAYGLGIVKDSDNTFVKMTSWFISSLYKIEKPSPKRYKALHKVFTDYHGEPILLFQRGNKSIALLDNTYGRGSGNYINTFTKEELKAFPINLNDFNLEEVSTTF